MTSERDCRECQGRCALSRLTAAPPRLPRRALLRLGAAGAILAPAACAGGGGLEAGDAGQGATPMCAPSCGADGAGPLVALPFAAYGALAQVGGSATISVAGFRDTVCGQDRIIVAQPSAGAFVALSASCTHACCTVQFRGQGFACPCHGSTYDLSGRVTGGPAPSALEALVVCADACGVYVWGA